MAQKQSKTTGNNLSLDTIERTAIDTSGGLGSLYDAYQDHVRQEKYLIDMEPSSEQINSTQCVVKDDNKNPNPNLLQLIDITEELRLSILFDIAPRTGIAAVSDYPYPVNKYTRVLCYTFVHRMEQLHEKVEKSEKKSKLLLPKSNITHIITGVRYGIHAAIVLRLPSDNRVTKKIHGILQKISNSLNHDQKTLRLDADEEDLLGKTTDIMVYSNIYELIEETTVFDICSYLAENKEKFINTPIMYILRPIKCIVPQYTGSDTVLVSIPSKSIEKVEQYSIQSSIKVKSLKYSLDTDIFPLLSEHLEKELRDTQREWLRLKDAHKQNMQRLKQLIITIRSDHETARILDQKINDKDNKTWTDSIDHLTKHMNGLQAKGQWITDLKQQGFDYCNVFECNINKKDNEQTLARKLTKDDQCSQILCCNDNLRSTKKSKLNQLRNELHAQCKVNPDLHLIYGDFQYSSYQLHDIIILRLIKKEINKQTNKPKATVASRGKNTSIRPSTEKKSFVPTSVERKTTTPSSSPSPPATDNFINILLLGETGVGKSTFINAFVNYLTSETFEHAQSNEPVVLIPVSFLLTIGDNFEERIVKFGDFVSSHNEDFDHPGESVTQHCKSYEFHLNRNDGKNLRIIDTPGFSDTRGLEKDDLNMQDILEYINNLTHLNAVCFLLKPNTSELHTFFRMCFTQLIDLLGPNVRENIIFCFTNARSTFYTPGDTAPLLKALLKSRSMNDIQFKKDNTFCFDNEAFRYLIALQNEIRFNDDDEHDYKMSWSTSVSESNRLIDYVCTQLGVCSMHNDRKSIKHAQIEIVRMIRPMLEAMRNILRNIILCKMESPNKSIKLCPKAIHRPATVCSSCTPYPMKIGNFWIVREIRHEFLKKCLVCSCAIDQHVPINYVLNFEDSNSPSSYQQNEMIDMVDRLCLAGAEFDHFLSHTGHSSKGDPFWIGLIRMILEEDNLCKDQKPNRLNVQLYKDLIGLKYEYEKQIENLKSNEQETALPNIYKWITAIHEYPIIQNQIDAIKETQKMMAEPYEVSQD